MITRETVIAAIEPTRVHHSWGTLLARVKELPEWVTDGAFLARVDALGEVESEQEIGPQYVKAFFNLSAAVPVVEIRERRQPGTPGNPGQDKKCRACDGTGSHGCERCDDSHDCRKCHGAGRVEVVAYVPNVLGRAVYRSVDGELTFVADRLATLLDGLSVVRQRPGNLEALLGLDEVGELRVVVMPMSMGATEMGEYARETATTP